MSINPHLLLRRFVLSLFAVPLLVSCSSGPRASVAPEVFNQTQERFHLGDHSFPISTKSKEAQAAFNRGLTLSYAFSHMTAEREFRRATELDPSAPMPWWGVALVNGPHINFPLVPAEKDTIALDALNRAMALRSNGSELERELIDAFATRHSSKRPEDRAHLDQAYASAMKKVWTNHRANADVTTLYAESLMDLHPWDLFDSRGVAKPWTAEILSTLEHALTLNDRHPGANHLYIHAVEASNAPERGLPAANQLRTLIPGAGHLLHMPAHIDIRVGHWENAAIANQTAILADQEFRKANPKPGFYGIYMLHNHHFLTFVRMMQGQRAAALEAASQMLAGIPADFMRDFAGIADGYLAIRYEVLMRFGQWKELLAEPAPAEAHPLAYTLWRFTRATALTALDRESDAQKERTLFLAAVKKVPADATFGNNQAHTILKIAQHVLDGEIAARKGRFASAIKSLQTAQQIEDSLTYDEPPDWILPVRHALGAVLLRAGKAKEAEVTYREDLKKFPRNGWSLYGLSRALEMQGNTDAAKTVFREFQQEWAAADTTITSSCLCQS